MSIVKKHTTKKIVGLMMLLHNCYYPGLLNCIPCNVELLFLHVKPLKNIQKQICHETKTHVSLQVFAHFFPKFLLFLLKQTLWKTTKVGLVTFPCQYDDKLSFGLENDLGITLNCNFTEATLETATMFSLKMTLGNPWEKKSVC